MGMVEIKMFVDSAVAADIKKKNFVEVVTRRANGRYKAFTKYQLSSIKNISEDKASELLNCVMNASKKNKTDMPSIRTMLSDMKKDMGFQFANLTDLTKNLSVDVDKIFSATKALKGLSYLNVGLSLANIAVDIAGFVIINKKLNELDGKVQALSDKMSDIEIVRNVREYRDLIYTYNSFMEDISLKKEIDLKKFDEFVKDLTGYLNQILDYFEKQILDIEVLLTILNALLPAYTLAVCEYIDRYYFANNKVPANFDLYTNLFDRLGSKEFIDLLEDYFFFDKKLNTIDTMDAISAEVLLGINGRVQIEDQVAILEELKTRDKIEELDKLLEKYAEEQFKEDIIELSNESEVWKEELLQLKLA